MRVADQFEQARVRAGHRGQGSSTWSLRRSSGRPEIPALPCRRASGRLARTSSEPFERTKCEFTSASPCSRTARTVGKAGLIVACCALLLACTGAAFAAGSFSGPQKKEISKIATKVAKKYAGKQGPAGKTGPTGPAGATGSAGPAGSAAAYATLAPSTSGVSYKINSGFSGSPTNPEAGVICIPAPVQAPVALTLQARGFIQQVAPNRCGPSPHDDRTLLLMAPGWVKADLGGPGAGRAPPPPRWTNPRRSFSTEGQGVERRGSGSCLDA
jgi:hypothetical protein